MLQFLICSTLLLMLLTGLPSVTLAGEASIHILEQTQFIEIDSHTPLRLDRMDWQTIALPDISL